MKKVQIEIIQPKRNLFIPDFHLYRASRDLGLVTWKKFLVQCQVISKLIFAITRHVNEIYFEQIREVRVKVDGQIEND